MANAAISAVLKLLGDELIKEIRFLVGVERSVKMLRNELRRMQFFLIDANKKQYKDERVRNWISEIRELAQDAADTIEMFLVNAENARNMNAFSKCTNSCKRASHLHTIGDEINYLREELAAISASRVTYGIKSLDEAQESASRSQVESMRRLSPRQKDEHLVSMEDDVKKVLRESILNVEKEGFSIAFLAGTGGIGKSTLAREIYNHPDVVGRFECRAWVVVSSEFTAEATIKELFMELKPISKDEKKMLHELDGNKLKDMLGEQLKGKSYFIVLDDVWTKKDLESLISAFPNEQGKASRLLVTTRNKNIAQHDQYVHDMKLLDPKKGWELLLKKVFIDGKCPPELENLGKQILKECDGLPLAINVAGGLLLMETQTTSGWEKALKHIESYLGRGDRVYAILELSYQNLSPRLKSCFLYLSFFKEDSTISAERLISIWDAQGLIQREGSRDIEEIGRGYLNELINRSMLQIQDLIYGDRVKSCRIHDLVREVCIRKAKEEIGLEIVKQGEEGNYSSEPLHKPRHRVVYGGVNLETFSSNQNKHIRSLFLLYVKGDYDNLVTAPSNYWKSYQLLTTLELVGCYLNKLPNSLRLLIGLKCLRIRDAGTYNLDLPRWLNHLKNLEVLDMAYYTVLFPRRGPLKLERLRYLCTNIVRGPTQISSWKNMECLKHITYKDWMRYSGSNLTSGCRLRELGISFFGKDDIGREELTKLKASLEKLQNLVILHLGIGLGGVRREGHIVEMELAIPNGLAILKLDGYMLKFPDATMLPPNLSHLTLDGSELSDDPMAEMGKLPNISFLELRYKAYMGETMQVLSGGFPCLETMAIVDLPNLESILIEEGGMPKLKQLQIRKCPKLETTNLPNHINISTDQ